MVERTTPRRTVLAATGSIALLGATGLVSALDVEVGTDGSSDFKTDSATLHGTLYSLGDSDTAFVQFAYGTDPNNLYLYTNHEAMSTTGSFSHDIDGLDEGTKYYFYARVESGDGSSVDTGETREFYTESDPGGGGGDDGGGGGPGEDPE